MDHAVDFKDLSVLDDWEAAEGYPSYISGDGLVVGSDARKHFVDGTVSDRADNPNTLGANASARPGRYAAREALAKPIDDKMFFAKLSLAPMPRRALVRIIAARNRPWPY